MAGLGGVGLFIAAAARAPLLVDEMYYWDWSRHLAAGYFDHPPMVRVLAQTHHEQPSDGAAAESRVTLDLLESGSPTSGNEQTSDQGDDAFHVRRKRRWNSEMDRRMFVGRP